METENLTNREFDEGFGSSPLSFAMPSPTASAEQPAAHTYNNSDATPAQLPSRNTTTTVSPDVNSMPTSNSCAPITFNMHVNAHINVTMTAPPLNNGAGNINTTSPRSPEMDAYGMRGHGSDPCEDTLQSINCGWMDFLQSARRMQSFSAALPPTPNVIVSQASAGAMRDEYKLINPQTISKPVSASRIRKPASPAPCCSRSMSRAIDDGGIRKHKSTITETDRFLAKELNDLTVEERNITYEEIHGLPHLTDETAESNRAVLKELEACLRDIPRKPAYDKALFLAPKYVRNEDFRMGFLRAGCFDPQQTAHRMVAYFETKQSLFGQDLIARDIELRDLSEKEREHLNGGSLQCMPSMRDKAGRLIFFSYGQFHREIDIDTSTRCSWFILETAFRNNVEAQRKGLVVIIYLTGITELSLTIQELFLTKCSKLSRAMPLRHASVHICYSVPQAKPFVGLLMLKMTKEARMRYRCHYGSHTEVQYEMQSYGILTSTLPVMEDGTPRKTKLLEYLVRIEEEEEARHSIVSPVHPKSNDVLLGRGRPYQTHSGNLRLSQLIEDHLAPYRACGHGGKGLMCTSIVQMVHDFGGRFLKRNDEWEVVSDAIAETKVSHSFRSKFKLIRRKEQKNKRRA